MRKIIFLVIGHLAFWLVSFYLITRIFGISTVEIIQEENNGIEEKVLVTFDHKFALATAITIALCAIIFYTNIFFFLKQYLRDRRNKDYVFKIVMLICIAVAANAILNGYINYGIKDRREVFLFPSFGLHMGLFIFYTVISIAYTFTLEWYKNEKLRSQIAEEKLSTELNFLKSQINPHFLFNTLNNLYSIAQKYEVEEISTGISGLSNLMRYMLYESNAEYVSLTKEVKYIESFIEIQQLRHDDDDELIVNFEKKGDFSSVLIAPMILLPFVENAFKHGFSLSENSIIDLFLEVKDSRIHFRAKNKAFKQHTFSDKSSGIGLENVKRRLDLIYPDRHELNITQKDFTFKVDLSIEAYEL